MRTNFLFSSLVVLTSSVAAQQPADVVEDILVTASRTPVPASRVGSSYTVITRADLDNRQIVYETDALRDVPGFAVSRAGTFGSQTQLRVRGAEANQVMVLIDGVEANDPALGDEFQFDQLMVTGIERIEIVRGPQSALWGSDALAGIVNLITTRGSEPFSADGYLEAGSFGTTHAGGHVTSTGTLYDINVDVSHLDTDGSNISRDGDEDDGNRNTTLNLNAGSQLSERTRIEFFARHTDSVRDYDGIDFVTTGLPTDADRRTDATQDYLRASAATAFLESRWTHRFRVTRLETANENFGDGASLGSTAAEKLGFYYQTSLALTESDSHLLTFAVDREEQKFFQRGSASPAGDPNQDQRVDTTGYVLEYQGLDLGPFSFSAALRHDNNSDFDDVGTYRVTGSYLVGASGTRLHASLGTGQKSPTFIERFGFFSGEFVGNPDLKPERSEGWEIGFEQPLRSESLSIAATYFDERLEDEIDGFVFDTETFLFTAANRPGKSRRQGIELQLTASPHDKLDLAASYTYTDSTELASLGAEVDELRRPKNMLAVNLNFSPRPRATINLNVSYNGDQDDIFFPPFPLPSERVRLDSYTLVDIAVSYRLTPTIQLVGRIENILDENYEDVVGFNTPGVGAYLGVRVGP